jgi:hypothetical protein
MSSLQKYAPHPSTVRWDQVWTSSSLEKYTATSARCLRDHLSRNLAWPSHFVNYTTLSLAFEGAVYKACYFTIGPARQRELVFDAMEYSRKLAQKGFLTDITRVPSAHASEEDDLCVKVVLGGRASRSSDTEACSV